MRCIIFGVIGALAFWGTDFLIVWQLSDAEIRRRILAQTFVPFTAAALVQIGLSNFVQFRSRFIEIVTLLVAIWITGPACMFANWTLQGAGYATPYSVFIVLGLTIFFPFSTFIMATYDGSLGALLLSTCYLILSLFFQPRRST
jgi:hypothetical protein